MADMLANPNTLPSRADMQVRADGILDLANFVAEVVPAPDAVLTSLGGDLREYSKLRRDDQVAALMQQRQDKLTGAEYEVQPGGDSPADAAAADFLREQLAGFNFDAACRKMHGALLYGYGVAECLWGRDGTHVTLRDIRVRAPWRFGFAKDRQLKLLVESRWHPMQPRKFWLVTWGAEDDDNPYGLGLGHQLWWPVYLKRNGARFWAAYLDRFGVPTTKATYPSDQSDAENEKRKKTALAAAMSLRSEGAVAMPDGFDVSLVESTSKGSGDFRDFLAYWDDAIAKIILSQPGTSRIGQYSGTAQVHSGIGASVVKADADILCQSFNTGPALWLTEWNFPGARPPQVWRKVEDPAKTKAQAEQDKNTAALGLELTDDEIARRYGDTWQRRGEARSGANAPQAGPSFSEAAAEPYSLELARQAQELADAPQTAMIETIRQELDKAVASGEDLASFAERMLALNKLPGVDELAAVLYGAMTTAHLAGLAGEKDNAG